MDRERPLRLCEDCLGVGARYSVRYRLMWPCPWCDGMPQPSTGPEFIRVHALRTGGSDGP